MTGNTGRAAAGSRLRRAPSELNFQSLSPASTGFLEDACVHVLSFIDRAGAFLRRPVRYLFRLNRSSSVHSPAPAAAPTALSAAAGVDPAGTNLEKAQPQLEPPEAAPPNSDLSARFGLSVSRIVCKAG